MKGINKNEILWVQYLINSEVKYIITSDKNRDIYMLYEVDNGQVIKTSHKNKDPTELETDTPRYLPRETCAV